MYIRYGAFLGAAMDKPYVSPKFDFDKPEPITSAFLGYRFSTQQLQTQKQSQQIQQQHNKALNKEKFPWWVNPFIQRNLKHTSSFDDIDSTPTTPPPTIFNYDTQEIFETVLQSSPRLLALCNLILAFTYIAHCSLSTVFLPTTINRQNLADPSSTFFETICSFFIFKLLLVTAVIEPDALDAFILFAWYLTMCQFKSLTRLANERVHDSLQRGLNIPTGAVSLLTILSLWNASAGVICYVLFRAAGASLLCVLLAECALLGLDLCSGIRIIIDECYPNSILSSNSSLVPFLFDGSVPWSILHPLLHLVHYAHLWYLHFSIGVVGCIILAKCHGHARTILRECERHRQKQLVGTQLDLLFADADVDDFQEEDERCCICLNVMKIHPRSKVTNHHLIQTKKQQKQQHAQLCEAADDSNRNIHSANHNNHESNTSSNRRSCSVGCYRIKKLPCGHLFHADCLRQVVERARSFETARCPMCRSQMLGLSPLSGSVDGEQVNRNIANATNNMDENNNNGTSNTVAAQEGSRLFRLSSEGILPAWVPLPAFSFEVVRRPHPNDVSMLLRNGQIFGGFDGTDQDYTREENNHDNDNDAGNRAGIENDGDDNTEEASNNAREGGREAIGSRWSHLVRSVLGAGNIERERVAVNQLSDMFPQHSREELSVELQRFGGNAELVVESIFRRQNRREETEHAAVEELIMFS